MRIAMIGGGYVGLVSGACFAKFGSNVAVVEADPAKLKALRTAHMPIYEPGLDQLVAENVEAGRLALHGRSQRAPSRMQRRCSLRWELRPVAAMVTPISATSMRPPNRWRAHSRAMR